jgi:serine/threonine protein kinase
VVLVDVVAVHFPLAQVYQMLRSLKYMHSAGVLHRDLKPSNLLLNSNCDLKVCDFGLARGVNDDKLALTEYVVTRWYRAPEIMLSCKEYTYAIDVWSVGCILGELLGRKPMFPGDDYIHQLTLITERLGTPSDDDLAFVTSDRAKRFMRGQEKRERVPFAQLFPRANPQAVDLLEKMLVFDPAKRITVQDALAHPYMESLSNPQDEPECGAPFEFENESDELNKRMLQELIWKEMCAFHPDAENEIRRQAAMGTLAIAALKPHGRGGAVKTEQPPPINYGGSQEDTEMADKVAFR